VDRQENDMKIACSPEIRQNDVGALRIRDIRRRDLVFWQSAEEHFLRREASGIGFAFSFLS
jgi:hypothetical protein